MKPVRTITAALFLAAGAAVFTAAPAYADDLVATPVPDPVCEVLDTGHLSANNETSFTISAPEGKLIAEVCVKAGSAQQGEGPEYETFDPPVESVTITHSSDKEISHYSVRYVPVTPPTTPPATTPPVTTPPVETTPPAGGGDGGVTLAETGFENGWLAFVGLGALAVGAAIAVPRMVAKRR